MAATPTTQQKPTVLIEIERLGFSYIEDTGYDLSQLDTKRRVQARDFGDVKGNDYAPKDEVKRYAQQMRHTQFPPIIVTKDHWIVDGNTRVGASLERDNKFFPAIVLDVEYGKGTAQRKGELVALAATLNQLNGRSLSQAERRLNARRLLEMEWTYDQISRALGVDRSTITAVKKEMLAEEKLRRVGLPVNGDGKVRGASLRALGGKDVLALNDQPFRQLAELSGDAGFNASEITSAAKEAKDSGSDNAAMEKLQALRQEMADRIRSKALTGTGHPPASRRLRQSLGYLLNQADDVPALVEMNPEVAAQHIDVIRRSIQVLQAVLARQEQLLS